MFDTHDATRLPLASGRRPGRDRAWPTCSAATASSPAPTARNRHGRGPSSTAACITAAEGPPGDPTVHERRRQPDGHLRLQARAGSPPRPAVRPGRATSRPDQRPGNLMKSPFAVQAARPVRPMGQQRLPAPRRLRRRPGVPDGAGVEDQRPRPGQLHDEHRLPAARLPVPGGRGSPTAWDR